MPQTQFKTGSTLSNCMFFSLQLEFGVDMKDCVAAVRETVNLARANPHTNMFTEVSVKPEV